MCKWLIMITFVVSKRTTMELNRRKKITIFVSSTFADMVVERDVINNEILSQLRADFAHRAVDIDVVDLRWGINTMECDESRRNHKILKVCMDEIDRCTPFFVGIIGGRFGWVPDATLLEECGLDAQSRECSRAMGVENPSVTAMEFFHALGFEGNDFSRNFLCLRRDESYAGMPAEYKRVYCEGGASAEGLERLKDFALQQFRRHGRKANVVEYTAKWGETRFANVGDFFDGLYSLLHGAIEQELGGQRQYENAVARMIDIQHEFQSFKLNGSVPRYEAVLNSLPGKNGLLVIHAPSGMGKSTTMAQLYEQVRHVSGITPIYYSAGAGDEAASPVMMLQCLSMAIADAYGGEYKPLSAEDYYALSGSDLASYSSIISNFDMDRANMREEESMEMRALRDFCTQVEEFALCRPHERLLVIVDGLNGLDDSRLVKSLNWLVSTKITAVVSTTTESLVGLELPTEAGLVEMNAFEESDARALIAVLPPGKELHPVVVEAILNKNTDAGISAYKSPLWLKLVLHVLVSLNADDFMRISHRDEADPEMRIHNHMRWVVDTAPPEPGDAFIFFLQKSLEYMGNDSAIQLIKFLACSGYGLRESDMSALMGDDWSPLDFAVLRRWLQPYITPGHSGQWCLSHDLFAETIKTGFRDEVVDTYTKLAEYVQRLPEPDELRRRYGMVYILNGASTDSFATSPLFYYIYSCRLPENIMHATNRLLAEVEVNPAIVDRLIEEAMKITDGGKRYDRYLLERLLFTFGNQLYTRGKYALAAKLYHAFVPQLQRAEDQGMLFAGEMLGMVSAQLADIDRHCYNSPWQPRVAVPEVDDSDPTSTYYRAIRMITENPGHPAALQILGRHDYLTGRWEENWMDVTAHALGDLLLALLVEPDDEEFGMRKSRFQILRDALFGVYAPASIAADQGEATMELEQWPRLIPDFHDRLSTVLEFAESILEAFGETLEGFGDYLQRVVLLLYRSLYQLMHNERSTVECALSHGLAARFYKSTGNKQRALALADRALEYAREARISYPDSIDARRRYAYSNHVMGSMLYDYCEYESALPYLQLYHDDVERLLEHDPSVETMLSSLLTAKYELGCVLFQSGRYGEAAGWMEELVEIIPPRLEEASESIALSWLEVYFNANYYIARINCICGREGTGMQHAARLYKEILDYGFPADCEFEPLENVRELLGL